MTVEDIHTVLRRLGGFYGIYVPEFTYGPMRIDAAIVDVSKRWIRGFEIKLTRSDFLRDEKWQTYTEFCSSLSIVCPEGLIRQEEVPLPSVSLGSRLPRVTHEQFLKWAGADVTDKLPPGGWEDWIR